MLSTFQRSLAILAATTLVAGTVTLLAVAPAQAATCTTTYTFTGGGVGSPDWATPANWQDGAVATSGAGNCLVINSDTTVASPTPMSFLQVTINQKALSIPQALSISADTLTLAGGVDDATRAVVNGTVAATTVSALGRVNFNRATDWTAGNTTDTIGAGGLSLAANTQLHFDYDTVVLNVGGPFALGSGVTVFGAYYNGSTINVAGLVALSGDATLDQVNLNHSSDLIALGGHALTVTNGTKLWLHDGDQIASAPAGGAVIVQGAARLQMDGTTSLDAGSTVHMNAFPNPNNYGFLTDTRSLATTGHPGTLTGTGTLLWETGAVEGRVTFNTNLKVKVVGNGDKALLTEPDALHPAISTVLTNKSKFFSLAGKFWVGWVVNGGSQAVTFQNSGIVTQTTTHVQNAGSPGKIINLHGGTWKVLGSVKDKDEALVNKGTVVIAANKTFTVKTFAQTGSGVLKLTLSAAHHSTLAATGKASLGGKIGLASTAGYRPSRVVTVHSVVKYATHSGRFSAVVSHTSRARTRWAVEYTRTAANAVLVVPRH